MKFIKNINKYSYNSNLIDNIELFIKLSNGIQLRSGDKSWYKNGLIHRENDKPAIEYFDGSKAWYINGQIHRENDKPAIEWKNGYKQWWINGELHRENDKPAIESADGILMVNL
jgi:antitoxin component YwqK of YwqJK toxin-antitoxin module